MNGAIGRASVALAVIGVAVASPARAQHDWVGAHCDIKPGHYLVNSAVLYLRSATETQYPEQRQKDLRDALRVLGQALTSGDQQKNPAAWYYLGRYYVEMNDAVGADSAFSKAVALAPGCGQDVDGWRRSLWVPVLNAGVAAWQAGNIDSAIASFRRANQLYTGEPTGFVYLATLLANAGQPDSAAKYFKLAIQAAQDPKYAKQKKDAMFNLARVYHAAKRYDEAAVAYSDYLAAYPGDLEATAGLASVYAQSGKPDQAKTLYAQILQHADSAPASDLFAAGHAILNGIPNPPDTAAGKERCRTEKRTTGRAMTLRQVTAYCDSVAHHAMAQYDASVAGDYHLVEQALEAGLGKDPYSRDGLFTLCGVAALAADTAKTLDAAQRLYAVDPLNRSTLRLVAQAWRLNGKADSTLHYVRVADSLPVEVTVTSFTVDDKAATVSGLLTNGRSKPTAPVTLTFEFLDAKGSVVATQQQEVASLAAGENRPFDVKATGAGIMAWRYHP